MLSFVVIQLVVLHVPDLLNDVHDVVVYVVVVPLDTDRKSPVIIVLLLS